MHYQVVILSEDAVFVRMLELEFAHRGMSVLTASALDEPDSADVLILDLDSAYAPPPGRYRKMIGFSRRPAITAKDARSCTMILRRPFRLSLLRREVLAQTGYPAPQLGYPVPQTEAAPLLPRPARQPERRRITLNEADRTLRCDGQTVSLSPQEFRLLRLLLEQRGKTVSRAALAEAIGAAAGNKTEVYICYLRRKTDGLPSGRLIRTVRGEGYCVD